ncbi:YdbC family protein [Amygdalobacter indicium]|jgi:hypothetical protein|nr:PC4/YdbC family ssDNA-binding protein [Amygdalobacter indicium]
MAITMEEKTKKQQVNEAMQVDSAQNKTTRYADNRKVSFEIKQHIAVLSRSASGWQKELNIVAWNGGAERYDIREWNPEHNKMSRGIGMNKSEIAVLLEALSA